nr:MAG TPA: hypothetical protein [Caudoviricetes sp.]
MCGQIHIQQPHKTSLFLLQTVMIDYSNILKWG